jgi:hypothetical protein
MEDNLQDETIQALGDNGKSPSDVMWCGSPEFGWFTWEDFMEVAPLSYDSGYGSTEIAKDLVIVGDRWWLERGEYDGSEWWSFKRLPLQPSNYRKPLTVEGDGYTLIENEEEYLSNQ